MHIKELEIPKNPKVMETKMQKKNFPKKSQAGKDAAKPVTTATAKKPSISVKCPPVATSAVGR